MDTLKIVSDNLTHFALDLVAFIEKVVEFFKSLGLGAEEEAEG